MPMSALLVLAAFASQGLTPTGPTDSLQVKKVAGVNCRIVRVQLADPRVRLAVQVSTGFPRQAESFASMVARSRPTVAVNGAYFSKADLKPIGDIVVDGVQVHKGMMGTALAVRHGNDVEIRRVRWGHAEDWSAYETVLACGPMLVSTGQPDVLPEAEGFRDPRIMAPTPRMGVGLTASRELLIVNALAPIGFGKWADIMAALGCTDALNLDAGASLAMYYRGKTLATPGRKLTNLLLVYVDSRPRADVAGAPTDDNADQPAPAQDR